MLVFLGGSWWFLSCSSLDEDEIEKYMCRFKIIFGCKLSFRCINNDDGDFDGDNGGGSGVGGGSSLGIIFVVFLENGLSGE